MQPEPNQSSLKLDIASSFVVQLWSSAGCIAPPLFYLWQNSEARWAHIIDESPVAQWIEHRSSDDELVCGHVWPEMVG